MPSLNILARQVFHTICTGHLNAAVSVPPLRHHRFGEDRFGAPGLYGAGSIRHHSFGAQNGLYVVQLRSIRLSDEISFCFKQQVARGGRSSRISTAASAAETVTATLQQCYLLYQHALTAAVLWLMLGSPQGVELSSQSPASVAAVLAKLHVWKNCKICTKKCKIQQNCDWCPELLNSLPSGTFFYVTDFIRTKERYVGR